jgi:AcrR family transcriptional regulator
VNVVNIGSSPSEDGLVERAYHHGALAEAMVNHALTAVREHGVEHVSLRAIAQALGVSPSAAYNHFADKDALLSAVGECGLAALDERMVRALASHPGENDQAARERFAGLGLAYISFAVEDPNIFRLVFGPICARGTDSSESTGPYVKLVDALDDLDRRELLMPGVRDGLDVTVWGATHGIASLIIEGYLPREAGDSFVMSLTQLTLR